MDRVIVYPSALPQTTDILQNNKFAMLGLAYLCRAALGTNTVVSDLACTPTSPVATLVVNVGVGSIYALDETDANAYGDLGVDTTVVLKQGILATAVALTITPPGTPGFSQVFLVQAILDDIDGGSAVLPYYNSNNPQQPFSGPQNSGVAQYTLRTTTCAIALKAGAPAPTGTEITPPPDPGYVGLYSIDVPNGATQVTAGLITRLPTAPFFPTLPAVPPDVQQSLWTYAIDTGTVNNIVATVYPPVTALVPGLVCIVKAAFTNTGSTTLNLNGLGAVAVHRATGAILSSGDITVGAVVAFMYDGAAWQVLNFTGATSGTVNNFFQSFVIPYGVAGGTANALTCTFTPAVAALTAGLVVLVSATATNTAAATLTPNGLATVNILENQLSLLPAAIVNGELLLLVYDGTAFQKINERNQIFSFNLASPPASPINLQVGDLLTVTFNGATSVPLHVASVPGIYDVDFVITSSNSGNTDVKFEPNDTTFGSSAFKSWQMVNSGNGASSPPYVAEVPLASFKGLSGTSAYNGFGVDLFDGPFGGDNINDVGPFFLKYTFSTYTAAKMARVFGGIAGGPTSGFGFWNDSSTAWTSLGTFIVYQTGGMNTQATISGTAVVRRLA